jgi:quinolinate synthase
MFKKAAYSICVVMYVNMSNSLGFKPNVVYTGDNAKEIFKHASVLSNTDNGNII